MQKASTIADILFFNYYHATLLVRIYSGCYMYLISATKFYLSIHLLIVSVVFSLHSNGQALPYGHVSDAKTGEPVANVSVEFMKTGLRTHTNTEGYFSFNATKTALNNWFEGEAVISGNTLIWSFNTNFDLTIYSHLGGKLNSKQCEAQGYIELSKLQTGLYLVHLSSSKGVRVYKMVASNGVFHLAGIETREKTATHGLFVSDTLQFSSENYFTRYVPVNYKDSTLDVQILKNKYDSLTYLTSLISTNAFAMLSHSSSENLLNQAESVKVLYNANTDTVYYINTSVYAGHYSFARDILEFDGSGWDFNRSQYVAGPQRYYYPITINYFEDSDIYTFEFLSGDGVGCEEINKIYTRILETTFFADKLYFYPTNQKWISCNQVPVISANEIYANQIYQPLNLAKSYGYIRKVNIAHLESIFLSRHDIVILDNTPIDISVVSGIITNEFQTPLSHINVLSHNRGTPNMAYRNAYAGNVFDSLIGKLVYMEVKRDTFLLQSATLDAAEIFWAENEPQDTINLKINTERKGLINLDSASIADVELIGGKAANFAEILNAFIADTIQPPVPEGYFAIPFYYYSQHMKKNGLDTYVDQFLAEEEFYTNYEYRKRVLATLRDSIVKSPIDKELLSMVEQELAKHTSWSSFRFRSSTNAEDIEGFNGAGLYSSFTGKVGDSSRSVDRAIKQVWASLWNFRAFDERSYFRISHTTCAMGILVHRSFPNEDANGVAITKNIHSRVDGNTVNAQVGEYSIVEPEPLIIHDEVMIYHFSIAWGKSYTLEYLSYSNVLKQSKQTVLSDEELYKLGDYLNLLEEYFYNEVYTCNCKIKDFALDIEFKVDSELTSRKLYIKQARLY